VNHHYSETRIIGFKRQCAFLALGPVILPVYMLYSLGYFLERQGYDKTWPRPVVWALGFSFGVINTLHNWFVCTILFTEFPREFTTTNRLKRLKTHADPAKRELADLLGGFLNSQDEGHY
jgi:hypothetical protein